MDDESESVLIPFETGVRLQDLPDSKEYPAQYGSKYSVTGVILKMRQARKVPLARQVEVNGRQVALWRYSNQVFATSPICPHQGSNLVLGDLEDIGNGLSITCPAHCWRFEVISGDCVNHKESSPLTIYPVFVDSYGRIFVEFESFDSSLFSSQDF